MVSKLIAQKILSILPAGEKANHRIQIIRGRFSDQYLDYRIKEIIGYFETYNSLVFEGATVLEIGTGWDAIAAVILYSLGAKKVITYDHIRHLRFEMMRRVVLRLRNYTEQLKKISGAPEEKILQELNKLVNSKDLNELLDKANIVYKISCNIRDLRIKPHSLDIIFSNATLEHVPEVQVKNIANMSLKLLKPGSFALHIIGHGDHSSKNSYVNFLIYNENLWQFIGMNRIFYHNRLRAHEVVKIITNSGGKIEKAKYRIRQKDLIELKKLKLDKKFVQMSPRQLAIYRSELLISY